MDGFYRLRDVAEKTDLIEVACRACGRHGRYILAREIVIHGALFGVPSWIAWVSRDCPRRTSPSPSIYHQCGAHCPELPALFGLKEPL